MGAASWFAVALLLIGGGLLAVNPLISIVWCVGWAYAFHRRPNWWKKEQD